MPGPIGDAGRRHQTRSKQAKIGRSRRLCAHARRLGSTALQGLTAVREEIRRPASSSSSRFKLDGEKWRGIVAAARCRVRVRLAAYVHQNILRKTAASRLNVTVRRRAAAHQAWRLAGCR